MTKLNHSVRNLLETLVSAPETLLALCKTQAPYELMGELITAFDIKDLSQERLLKVIQYGDGYAIEPDLTQFLSVWRPAGYRIEQGEINWRLMTGPLPFAPFYDDRLRLASNQSILATLLKPRVHVDYLQHHQAAIDPIQPKGFIFHLSRCGSTLVANTMEATGHFSVVSEASYLTNLLLDPNRSEQQKIDVLKVLLSCHPPNPLIKFNAWDIDFLPLIHKAFPSTPMIFLIRDPERILASHQRISGIHMVPGNPVAKHIGVDPNKPLPDYQAAVLIRLMETMIAHQSKVPTELIMTLDYSDIDLNVITEIAAFFGCQLNPMQKERVSQMMKRDSKATNKLYAKNDEQRSTNSLALYETINRNLKTHMQALYRACISSHIAQTSYKGVM